MKIKTQNRRCSECSRPFVPDPRVRDRQVTCGDPACQQQRHAAQCKRWHQEHQDEEGNHYRDVVVPFRQRHPTYQRRWRLGYRLREIREETAELVQRVRRRVATALAWARALGLQAPAVAQVAGSPGGSLEAGLASASRVGELLGQLAVLTGQLEVRPS